MDHQQIVTFDRIVREGSFNRAARVLNVSQAAISGRIQALEAEIGGPLFVRGGRRITLTEAGENFLPYARRAIAVLAEGMEAARETRSGQYGRVTIGAVDSIADGLLVSVITRYRVAYPHVRLSVRTGHTPQILQELADGIVRLGLVTWGYLTGTVEVEVLARFREPLVAVAAPRHPLARRAALTVDELVNEAEPYHETVWGTAEDARIAPTSGRGWDEHELPHGLMRQLILRGVGAGFLPTTLVADDLAAGRLVTLPLVDTAGLARELALVRHTLSGALPSAARGFVETLRAELAPIRMEWADPHAADRAWRAAVVSRSRSSPIQGDDGVVLSGAAIVPKRLDWQGRLAAHQQLLDDLTGDWSEAETVAGEPGSDNQPLDARSGVDDREAMRRDIEQPSPDPGDSGRGDRW